MAHKKPPLSANAAEGDQLGHSESIEANDRRDLVEALFNGPLQALTDVDLQLQRLTRSTTPELSDMLADIRMSVLAAFERTQSVVLDLSSPIVDEDLAGRQVEGLSICRSRVFDTPSTR